MIPEYVVAEVNRLALEDLGELQEHVWKTLKEYRVKHRAANPIVASTERARPAKHKGQPHVPAAQMKEAFASCGHENRFVYKASTGDYSLYWCPVCSANKIVKGKVGSV